MNSLFLKAFLDIFCLWCWFSWLFLYFLCFPFFDFWWFFLMLFLDLDLILRAWTSPKTIESKTIEIKIRTKFIAVDFLVRSVNSGKLRGERWGKDWGRGGSQSELSVDVGPGRHNDHQGNLSNKTTTRWRLHWSSSNERSRPLAGCVQASRERNIVRDLSR